MSVAATSHTAASSPLAASSPSNRKVSWAEAVEEPDEEETSEGEALASIEQASTTGQASDLDLEDAVLAPVPKTSVEVKIQAIQRMRSRTRSKLRPVRAIMITQGQQGSAGTTEPEESWGPKLSEFEESYGKTWQFGPLNEVDGDALQATFGEMASVRIKQNEAGEGIQMFNEEEEDVLLLESEMELQDPEFAERTAEERLDRVRSGGSRMSETSSQASEGAHKPPMFEAEFEGSQCSESAMELHARTFGLEDAPSPGAS